MKKVFGCLIMNRLFNVIINRILWGQFINWNKKVVGYAVPQNSRFDVLVSRMNTNKGD